jgi:hypothetical protein
MDWESEVSLRTNVKLGEVPNIEGMEDLKQGIASCINFLKDSQDDLPN